MKTKTFIKTIILVISISICSINIVTAQNIKMPAPPQKARIVDENKDRIFTLDESKLTPKEIAMKYKILDLVVDSYTIVDGQYKTSLTVEKMKKHGIDPYYFSNVESDLQQMNEMLRLNEPSAMERTKILEAGLKEYRDARAKRLKSK